MRTTALGIAATTAMAATTVAAALIWMVVTDPMSVATVAASGNVWALLTTAAGRVVSLFW
jgi:hypothetical protein